MNTKLNKNIEIVEGEIKKYEGNTFVGFIICLLFLIMIFAILEITNIFKITPYINNFIEYITKLINEKL